jgi:hypothetical protein
MGFLRPNADTLCWAYLGWHPKAWDFISRTPEINQIGPLGAKSRPKPVLSRNVVFEFLNRPCLR